MTTKLATSSFPEQLKNIKHQMGTLSSNQPGVMKAFESLNKAACAPGVLDTKTKELIALAIGVAVHCDGCISFHTNDCLKAGATREEIYETLGVAVMMGGGPSVVYATHVIEAIDQFEAVGLTPND